MRWQYFLVALASLLGIGLVFVSPPDANELRDAKKSQIDALIQSRKIHIDPAELQSIIYNANIGVRILDVRSEAEYNLFHIIDAIRVTRSQILDSTWIKAWPSQTVYILTSNDEKDAEEAFSLLYAQKPDRPHKLDNLYILEGGIHHWLSIFGPQRLQASLRDPKNPEVRQYRFDAALGDRHPESDPDPAHSPKRKYSPKVKPIGGVSRKAGGCG